jgi:6-phosphofructokinase 1
LAGLLEAIPDDTDGIAANVAPLNPASVWTIDRSGGTMVHTSRTNPGRVGPGNVPDFLADQAVGEGALRLHTARDPGECGGTRRGQGWLVT